LKKTFIIAEELTKTIWPHAFRKESLPSKCDIKDYNIVYGSTQMCAYCDKDWVGNMDDCKLKLNYVFLLGNGVIK
jgi:hypothetical protein